MLASFCKRLLSQRAATRQHVFSRLPAPKMHCSDTQEAPDDKKEIEREGAPSGRRPLPDQPATTAEQPREIDPSREEQEVVSTARGLEGHLGLEVSLVPTECPAEGAPQGQPEQTVFVSPH